MNHRSTITVLTLAILVMPPSTLLAEEDEAYRAVEEVAAYQISLSDLNAAIKSIQAQAARIPKPGSVESEPTKDLRTHDEKPGDPPDGAAHHPGLDENSTRSVESEGEHLPLDAPKAKPESGDGPADPSPHGQLSFTSFDSPRLAGLDERLLTAVEQVSGRRYTYGFVILNEYLDDRHEAELAEFGVTLLDEHGSAYTARLPVSHDRLAGIEKLPYVLWLGYADPDQKIDPALENAINRFSPEISVMPVMINFFESEAVEMARESLRRRDLVLGNYDEDLAAIAAIVPIEQLDWLTRLDSVLFIELERSSRTGHDQSMAVMGVDYIRPGGSGTRFSGSSTILGIMDTGFMVGSAAATMHQDLNKWGCGRNFTSDAADVWNDQNGHGSHVLGTVIGTGTANARNRGVAMGVGGSGTTRIRAAKIWTAAGTGNNSWMRNAMDFMDNGSECGSGRPRVINISGGATGTGQVGTDSNSRKLDAKVWKHQQAYIVCSGNSGANAETIWSPGVAKNALTVGNVLDNGLQTVGDIRMSSSRGPSGDDRMKPNLVATGTTVTSVNAGTTNDYTNQIGCSMATPHVSGIASTLLQHYSVLRDRPYLLRAHLMAASILHDDTTTPSNNSSGGRNTYGLGRVSSYIAHWAHSNPNGWNTYWATRTITRNSWGFRDITVPNGARRLVVVLTWDEPRASSGASKAVKYDVDLWADFGADCTPDPKGQCGEWASQSWDDSVEYLIINSPRAGTYRLKMINWKAPKSGIPVAIAATVIRGDPTPSIGLAASASNTSPPVGSTVQITTTVRNPSYVASGVHLSLRSIPSGLAFQDVTTQREEGVTMAFTDDELSLGNIVQGRSRQAVWRFRVTDPSPKTLRFVAWGENTGTLTESITLTP